MQFRGQCMQQLAGLKKMSTWPAVFVHSCLQLKSYNRTDNIILNVLETTDNENNVEKS